MAIMVSFIFSDCNIPLKFFCSQALVEIEGCKHPTVMKDMCAECGADLRRYT